MDGSQQLPQGTSGGSTIAIKKICLSLIFLILLCLILPSVVHNVQAQTTYSYNFTGPTYDSGLASSDTIRIYVLLVNNTIDIIYMNGGAIGWPNSVSKIYVSPVNQITWNDSSALNLTRVITLQAGSTNIAFKITDPSLAYGIYTFPVTDFFGMQHPYLRVSGPNAVAPPSIFMQADLSTSGTPSFVLQQYQTYTLSFICDQGTYSQQFMAENTYTTTLQINSGNFPQTTTNSSITSATRTNATTITITYADADSATTWLYTEITHQDGTYLITDFTANETISPNSVSSIVTVDNETDYFVKVEAYRYGGVVEWDFACPTLAMTNPFTGLFDFLGTWPTGFDPAQIFAAGLIMCCLGLGSFRSAGVSCVLAWIFAGIFLAFGWFTIGIPMFAFSGVLSIIVALTEAKETTRDA